MGTFSSGFSGLYWLEKPYICIALFHKSLVGSIFVVILDSRINMLIEMNRYTSCCEYLKKYSQALGREILEVTKDMRIVLLCFKTAIYVTI